MYSFTKITTVADCDVLLTWAEREKSDLIFKKMVVARDTVNYSVTSVEIEAILQGVLTELSAVDIVINTLPDGPTKVTEEKRKKRLEYRKFLLENRKESYGTVALLEKELDLERINNEVDEVEVFIAGVTTHKSTL